MRELVWMTNEVNRDRWDRAADLMALTANLHRGRRTRPFARKDFHPYLGAEPKQSITKSQLHELKGLLPVHYVTAPTQSDKSKAAQ